MNIQGKYRSLTFDNFEKAQVEFVNIYVAHFKNIEPQLFDVAYSWQGFPQSFAKSVKREQSLPSRYYANFVLSVVFVRRPMFGSKFWRMLK